jgi:CheY-like chemotaxis protein
LHGERTGRFTRGPLEGGNVVRPRVLIVDDYEDNGEVLAAVLASRGYETRYVSDASTALAAMQDFQPEVAVVDILLPDMDGYALGRAMHAIPGFERLCLIALSGFSRDPAQATAAGFHGHVLKPVSLDKLEKTIAECHAIATATP